MEAAEDGEVSGSSIHEKEDCAMVDRVGIGAAGRFSTTGTTVDGAAIAVGVDEARTTVGVWVAALSSVSMRSPA